MKTTSVMFALSLGLLTGCTDSKNQITFDGHYFRTKVAKVDKQRDVFTVRIRDVAQSLEGARAAGRHAGIAYCVENFGSSKIRWSVGPETPPEQLQIVDNTLVFQGVCPQL
ncbi:hypothetical protein OS190_07585 [Sulfitobacter sp. F26204]|uniref:hypothetical protein n=1 Tax=Sulfitobacter sp. F26204 TaxID=2996014 RepID=UPI00225E6678|nr:hypothetical protein [Sulfitobacter sp. F26204]MCX7559429.1 hypothetical protein [Sulfitobacter sp. F26204]